MSEAQGLSDFQRHCLFEACAREADRLGGDERTTEYFFVRAQTSRIWLSRQGSVTIADMDIRDWCAAIAWSAPGIRSRSQRAAEKHIKKAVEKAVEAANDTGEVERKQARSGARFRRTQND